MNNVQIPRPVADEVAELITGIPVVMLTTSGTDGSLRSRPMVNVNSDFKGVLWFFTGNDDSKAVEILNEPSVNVSIVTPALDRYLSLTGIASIVNDKNLAAKLWIPVCVAWFPGGLEDPHLALIRVEVKHTDFWDVKVSKDNPRAVFVGQFPGATWVSRVNLEARDQVFVPPT